jgi:hypothetical protein
MAYFVVEVDDREVNHWMDSQMKDDRVTGIKQVVLDGIDIVEAERVTD